MNLNVDADRTRKVQKSIWSLQGKPIFLLRERFLFIDVGPLLLGKNAAHSPTCKRKLIRKPNKFPFLPSRYVKGSVRLALT